MSILCFTPRICTGYHLVELFLTCAPCSPRRMFVSAGCQHTWVHNSLNVAILRADFPLESLRIAARNANVKLVASAMLRAALPAPLTGCVCPFKDTQSEQKEERKLTAKFKCKTLESKHGKAGRWTDWEADRQTDRQTQWKGDSGTDRQKDTQCVRVWNAFAICRKLATIYS